MKSDHLWSALYSRPITLIRSPCTSGKFRSGVYPSLITFDQIYIQIWSTLTRSPRRSEHFWCGLHSGPISFDQVSIQVRLTLIRPLLSSDQLWSGLYGAQITFWTDQVSSPALSFWNYYAHSCSTKLMTNQNSPSSISLQSDWPRAWFAGVISLEQRPDHKVIRPEWKPDQDWSDTSVLTWSRVIGAESTPDQIWSDSTSGTNWYI